MEGRYKNQATLIKDYNLSRSTVYRLVKRMVASGRYPPDVRMKNGRTVLIHEESFKDFFRWEDARKEGVRI